MKYIYTRICLLFLLLIVAFVEVSGQTTIWSEDFSSYSGYTGVDGGNSPYRNLGDYPGGVTKWTINVDNCTLSNDKDYVQLVGDAILNFHDVDGKAYWTTESINISSYTNVGISIDLTEQGNMGKDDFIECEYRLNGSDWVQFYYKNKNFNSANAVKTGLVGNTLKIRVCANNNNKTKYHRIDNVIVTGDPKIAGTPPTANCQDLTVQLDASGNASISAADINNSSSDVETADADLILSLDKTSFDCDDVGSQTVTLTVEDGDGNESTCTANVTVVDNVAPSLLNLNAEYYTGMNFGEKKYSESVSEIHNNWGSGSPNSSLIGNDHFSVFYNGSFVVPETGDYTFYTNSDDGVRLFIDGSNVINNWTNHAPRVNTGTRNLSKGEHTIMLQYYENTGGAVIELEWESSDAGISKQTFSKSSIKNNTSIETTLTLNSSGNATLVAADVDPGFLDNCAVTSRTLSKSNFTSADIGENTVVLTIKDASGNSTNINVKVIVEENNEPSTASIEINTQDASVGTIPDSLVQNVLVTGCLIAENVSYTGDQTNGIGYFEKGDSDFPLSSGVILSTGNVENAIGPASNHSSDQNSGFDFDKNNQDSDLITLAETYYDGWSWNRKYYDAQVLEFDFIPAGDKLEFNYIFASEEYNGYACSGYNDGFAFILSGPDIGNDPGLSGKNIALTESGDQVSINNVYKNQCSGYSDNSDLYVEEIGGYPIAFDGRTIVLTAKADVTSCETYHIKLIVYDRNDYVYNSAVFLEAKSFKSNEVIVENRIDGIDGDKEVMYRGCDKSYISFTRTEETDQEYSFHIGISGSAENGVDYYEVDEFGTKIGDFPEDVSFAAGETEIKIYYMASDEVTGSKDILFEVLKGCPCSADDDDYFKKHIDIIDVAQIEAEAISNVRCNGGDPVSTIIIQLAEGLVSTNYLYSLDGGSFQEENKFQGTYTVGEHIVTIKDKFSCGSEDIKINIPEATDLEANAGADIDMCEKDDSKTLNGTGGINYLWTCNKSAGLVGMDATSPTPSISSDLPADTYTYTLTVSDGVSDLCSSSDDVVVTVKQTPVINSLGANRLEVCSGQEIILTASVSNGINPTYKWTPNDEINGSSVALSATIKPVSTVLASRTIDFEVTSDNSCSASQSIGGIKVYPNPSISLIDATSNLCADGNNGEIHIEATGGTPNMADPFYIYEWSHNSSLDSPDATSLGVDSYTITVSDAKACTDTKTFNVTAQPKPKGVFFE